jgi:hypothetical protein
MRTRAKLMISAVTTIAALILAGPAQASTAADDQYGAVLGEHSGGGPQAEATGGLPFTGLNLLLMLGGGTGLAASGIALRRAARPRPSSDA